MSLIRKHVAVLQAWACLDLVNKNYARQSPPPIYAILHGAVSCKGSLL